MVAIPIPSALATVPMRKLLLQLDSNRLPSVFDRVVGYDAGADEILSYGGIVPADVRDLIYGLIFTRGPKDLHNSAVFVDSRVAFDQNNAPMRLTVTIFPVDRNQLVVNVGPNVPVLAGQGKGNAGRER